ncbi:MAG: flagellar export chaperone FliS [Dethiobacter sp.]|nr:MAG: flagellar export chaperone FliS [Dethiobacter sp.]
MRTDPYHQYKQNEVGTASPEKLLLMLYNAALKFLKLSRVGVEEKNIEKANMYIGKAQDIIYELMASLDFEQENIPEKLYYLYDYMNQRLVQANIKKNAAIIKEVEGMLTELRDTWKAATIKG